jgi:phosphatidate cytidylyltransferase
MSGDRRDEANEDDAWRRGRDEFDDEDFGPPLFADDPTGEIRDTSGALSFGNDTGPLPHWTEPPTGEMPRTINQPAVAASGEPTDDLDVWSSFGDKAPVWSDDPAPTGDLEAPTGALAGDDLTDSSAPVPRREPGRITIGTDPTEDRVGRPMPKSRSRSSDPSARNRTAASARPGAAPATSGRDMPTAVAAGLLIAAAFIGSLLIAPWATMAVVTLVVGLAAIEFFDKVTEKGYRPATVTGIVASVGAPLAAYWVGETAIPLVLVLALAAGCATFIFSSGLESNPMPNMAITMLGITWIGLLGAFAALIVSLSNFSILTADGVSTNVGTDTLFVMALAVVANDIGALFIGSAAGRTPLRQWISPNKTVEGFLGGAVMTVLAMVVVGVSGKSTTWNSTGDLIILGVVVAITAPLGDLTESMFKRNLDVKDFGSLIKGHGGVLDRFDGFLFTLPATYYLIQLLEPWVTK